MAAPACPTEDYSHMVPANEPHGPLYLLDGEPVSIDEFCQENELDAADRHELLLMAPGEERVFGGGAAATFTLRRVE